MSLVIVLAKMLSLCGRTKPDERVKVALEAVRSCCKAVLGASSNQSDDQQDWIDLQHRLPKQQLKRRFAESAAAPVGAATLALGGEDIEAEDVLRLKRVRRLNRGICIDRPT